MLPRFEFGHLSKFIVSVGLVLVAVSVIGPFLLQQSLSVLLVSGSDLEALAPDARRTIELRQSRALLIEPWIPWLAVLTGLVGLALIGWGYVGWRRRQKRVDEGEDYDVATKRAQVEALSPDEVAQKIDEEAAEIKEEKKRPAGGSREPAQSKPEAFDERRERIRATEGQVLELVSNALSDSYTVEPNMRLRDDEGGIAIVDILATPVDSSRGTIAVEVKALPHLRFLRLNLVMVQIALAARMIRLVRMRSSSDDESFPAPARSLLIAVADETPTLGDVSRAEAEHRRISHVLRYPVSVLIVGREDLPKVEAAVLRKHLGAARGRRVAFTAL